MSHLSGGSLAQGVIGQTSSGVLRKEAGEWSGVNIVYHFEPMPLYATIVSEVARKAKTFLANCLHLRGLGGAFYKSSYRSSHLKPSLVNRSAR